jgi:phosphofructokinase-like protein
MGMRVGVLCGGGDCPGLNAVIRAVVHRAGLGHGMDVVGIHGSFQGLLQEPARLQALTVGSVSGILTRGGTILGTTNRGDPFHFPVVGPDGAVTHVNRGAELRRAVDAHGLQGLIVLGGDGTQALAWRLMQEHGVNVIGVPKTIDNDLGATSATFGFMSAVDVATDAVDRLHSTAESHDRVMVLEVMGRDAGHIALAAGVAGGADVILIPEVPFSWEAVANKVRQRKALGRLFSIVVVAEGASPAGGAAVIQREADALRRKPLLGGIGALVASEIERMTGSEARVTVLGHLQRGGTPAPMDRVLATALGVHAADMAARGGWGRMATLRFPDISDVPLAEAVGVYRRVDPEGAMAQTARKMGVCLG